MTDRGYALAGWRVVSEIALPELAPWAGDDREPDLVIALGEVPAALEAPALRTPIAQIETNGRARFHIEAVATYLVEPGRITVDPRMPADSPDVRLFLFGTPFGILCHQRGLVPLHASVVEVDGEAIVFAGPSGVGKSTLAAAFQRRGYQLLGDDVAPLRFEGERAVILPGIRRVRLWRDSAQAAGWDTDALEKCRTEIEKYSHSPEGGFGTTPLRPRALIHLERLPRSVGEASFRRLRGRQAVRRANDEIFRVRTLHALRGDAEALLRSTRLAGAIPSHYVLSRPHRFEDLDAHVDMVLETVRARA